MTLEEMTAQRDGLLAARYRGLRTVEIDGRRVTYARHRDGGCDRRSGAAYRARWQRRSPSTDSRGVIVGALDLAEVAAAQRRSSAHGE
jgi:hypothetical protein